MPLGIVPVLLLLSSGAVVGLTLGLIGGGGSVLAVPLLVYLVGVPSAHVAIGSSAVAVALNAAWGLVSHARLGTVKWPCAIVFTAAGVSGAFAGASLGKQLDRTELLALFGLAMIAIGVYMLTFKPKLTVHDVKLTRENAAHLLPRLLAIGAGVGLLSGFFGIGGGFLIVPGMMFGGGIPILKAIGSSLLSVGTFGLTTAINYALSGWVDWVISILFICGGVVGGIAGVGFATRLAQHRGVLRAIFAGVVIIVAILILLRI